MPPQCHSIDSPVTTKNTQTPLLQQRLVNAGVSVNDISFRGDDDDDEFGREQKGTIIVEIKTLVWEVQFMVSEHDDNKDENSSPIKTMHVVVTLPMKDKVDETLLRDLIYKHVVVSSNNKNSSLISSIKMAPTSIAEQLTGFTSGCMPPIGHATRMPLLVDSSINAQIMVTNKTAIASIGSGVLGQSLLLPLNDFLRVAAETAELYFVGSVIHKASKPNIIIGTTQHNKTRRQQVKEERAKGPQPKDRLKEYRTLNNILDKAKLLRTTARKRGRYNDVKTLIDEAVATGEYPKLFAIDSTEGFSKHALHICAWRGDLESVKAMVDASRQYDDFDIVNGISKSFRNYGKTPIFYALTQCREDVVRYLVDAADASLLFVNNKGQTPCSIAVSHLSEAACEYLCDVERNQLEAGGTFQDYRMPFSDDKYYGDLDPRFPIENFIHEEDDNDDLIHSLRQYQAAVKQADEATVIKSIPTKFAPRSLRPTVRWWNRNDKSLEDADNKLEGCQANFTRSEEKLRTIEETRETKKSKEEEKSIEVINVASLDLLRLDSVLARENPDKAAIILVDCIETLKQLEAAIDDSIEYIITHESSTGDTYCDDVVINVTWGLDAEWKPGIERGKDNPAATLQLSTRQQSYLIDLQSICQSTCRHTSKVSDVKLTYIEEQLNDTLAKLFRQKNLFVLGFGILQDLGKLAASFPHLSCFTSYFSVIDLQSITSILFSKNLQPQLSSLQKIVAFLFGKRLDKKQQCSDWTQRPLSRVQIEYAVLDAAVLPLLLQTILNNSDTVEGYNGKFLALNLSLSLNLRYTLLDESSLEGLKDSHEWVWHVPMGCIRRTLSPDKQMARQCWPSMQSAPDLPKPSAVDLSTKVVTKKERVHLAKVHSGKKTKPIQLDNVDGNLDNLPTPGMTLGYTKDSCAIRVLGHEFMAKIPETAHIGFNRRSGVAETKNAWLLFCNFGMNISSSSSCPPPLISQSHPSEFSAGGQYLTFKLKAKQKNVKSSEKALWDHILSSATTKEKLEYPESASSNKAILLFARGGQTKKYVYCGCCRCDKYAFNKSANSVDLVLELLDYQDIIESAEYSSCFLRLVRWREEISKQRIIMNNTSGE